MKKTLGALLLLLVSFMATSCDRAYLKIAAEAADKQCPMKLDDGMGSITSIKYEDNALIYNWSIANSEMTLEQIKAMPNSMKASITSEFKSEPEALDLMKKIINENAKLIYRVSDGTGNFDLTMTAAEIQSALNKNTEDIASKYPRDNENVQIAIVADINELVNLTNMGFKAENPDLRCILEGKSLVLEYPVESLGLTVDAVRISANSVKQEMRKEIKPNIDPSFETCAIQGYNYVARYYSKSGASCDITFTPEELKECLGFN